MRLSGLKAYQAGLTCVRKAFPKLSQGVLKTEPQQHGPLGGKPSDLGVLKGAKARRPRGTWSNPFDFL